MRKFLLAYGFFLLTSLSFQSCKTNNDSPAVDGDSNSSTAYKYDYKTAPNDPLNVLEYTLENGFKIYMSVYKDAPRINTMIAVKAGSKNDPAETTGLAHYLEHMLFKGTSKIGALDWTKEEPLLQKISDLYEDYRKTTDPEKRTAIYAEIDKTSNEAAKFVNTNEYDKMISAIGAKGTNAFTSYEQTVYLNDIPSNEVAKWMEIEGERFKECVLRLFHTELEAVYEEFNRAQDNDGRKVQKAFMSGLLKNHPYGTQTTIGEGEHLKNPSHVNIQEYFKSYYVPNNMALIISGDFDPDEIVDLAKKNFGSYERKEVPKFTFKPEVPKSEPEIVKVYGPEKEALDIGWVLPGIGSDERILAELTAGVLSNGQAGLIDIDLLQKQKVGEGTEAYGWGLKDYSFFGIYGNPRDGQSLDQLKELLFAQLDKVKKGQFEDWLIKAVIKDKKLAETRSLETNNGRVFSILDGFIMEQGLDARQKKWARMKSFTKQDIVDFLNKYIHTDNCVVIYKLEGEDADAPKMVKPQISPLPVLRDTASVFQQKVDELATPGLKPVFVDFDKAIQNKKLAGNINLDYIKNEVNETFKLRYILDMGRKHDPKLPLAIKYLPFLGTEKYTPEQLQQEFFKLGLSFDVFSDENRVYVSLSGLDESFEEGVKLFEHILLNVKPDQTSLDNMISDILKDRADVKKNKRMVMRGLVNFAIYGPKSSYTDKLTQEELEAITPEELVAKIKSLTTYEHRIFYYGTQEINKVATILKDHHKTPSELKGYPQETVYPELKTEPKVAIANFPGMVQAQVLMISKGTEGFNLDEFAMEQLYNNYFGSGLSSIVFQEIREAKALAYSAYAFVRAPEYSDRAHMFQAFVGTQSDKMKDAIIAFKEILENMPVSEDQINGAKESLLKKYESERITRDNIYWTREANKLRGYDRDIRKDVYEKFKGADPELGSIVDDLKAFQASKIKGRDYMVLVLGDKTNLDMDFLKEVGPVTELTLEELFGY